MKQMWHIKWRDQLHDYQDILGHQYTEFNQLKSAWRKGSF